MVAWRLCCWRLGRVELAASECTGSSSLALVQAVRTARHRIRGWRKSPLSRYLLRRIFVFSSLRTAKPASRPPNAISRTYEQASTHRSRPNQDVGKGKPSSPGGEGEGAARSRLTELSLPVLVANGVLDVMIPAEHSFAIVRTARNAKLVLYPDAGHAFLFQYAEEFSREVLAFL